jgi:hypothetical protein
MDLLDFTDDRYNSKLYKLKTSKMIILNSNYATKIALVNGKNTEFRFNIRNIQIDDYAELKLEGIYATGTLGTSIYTFKSTNLLYNNRSYFNSDNSGYPTIATSYFGTNNMYYKNIGGLMLMPQNIDNITLIITDSLSDINAGITNDINFSIILYLDIYTKIEK